MSLHVQDAFGEHRYTVVLLHGRGNTAQEFAVELSSTASCTGRTLFEQLPNVRWVFPSAAMRWSTVFREMMSEWFDTPSLSDITLRQHLQVKGLKSSVEFVQGVIQDEMKLLGGDASKLVLGGISQGQATSLHVLLNGNRRLGGYVGASGWLPFANRVEDMDKMEDVLRWQRDELGLKPAAADGSVLDTPVFLGHGTNDEVVDLALGRQARDVLKRTGMKQVSWNEYTDVEYDGHWLKEPEELDDIVAFIKSCFDHSAESSKRIAQPVAGPSSEFGPTKCSTACELPRAPSPFLEEVAG